MGLFSGKKKTYVNTSISRLIEDKDIPDLNEVAMYDYLYSNINNRNGFVDMNSSLSTHILSANANSVSAKMRTARAWAKNNYTYGVPEAKAYDAVNDNVVGKLEGYLRDKTGKNVRLVYGLFMPANALHITWQKLVDYHGYDTNNNKLGKLSTQLGTDVYLEDIQIRYCSYTYEGLADPETVMQYGLAATHGKTPWRANNPKALHTPFVNDPAATKDYALVTYSYSQNGNKKVGTFTIDFLDYEWSGLEPVDGLDDSDSDKLDPDAIAPIVDDVNKEKDYIIAQYYTIESNGVESLNYLTYEYESYTDPVLENLFRPSNALGSFFPNIYLRLYGTNLASEPHHTTDEYKSSKKLSSKLGMKYKTVSDDVHKAVGSLNEVTQMFISTQLPVNSEDPLTQKYMYEYFYSLYNQLPKQVADTSYSSLDKDYVNGFSKPGISINIADRVYGSRVAFKSIGYIDVKGSIGSIGTVTTDYEKQEITNKAGGFARLLKSFIGCHTFRKQLTDTTYREITVYGLTASQEVQGGKSTTAAGTDENLYIPTDDLILDKFKTKDRVILLSKSLIIMINTLKVVKQKWYQTGAFKVLMVVVAVVITIITVGVGAGALAIVTALAKTFVVGTVINLAIRFAVKKLDIDLGVIFAIVAVVLVLVGGGIALSNSGNIMGMTSKQFLMAANYSVQISSESNKIELGKMVKAHQQLSNEMETKFKELAELQEEMNPDKFLTPYYLLSDSVRAPDIRVGEIMNDFIIRTLSVDSGLAPLSLIANMAEVTLQLPTFQQTYQKMMQQRSTTYEL